MAALLRMFSSAVLSQAVLSASSLIVGLLLVRLTSDQQYGSYVLVWSTLILLNALQNAFLGPSVMTQLPRMEAAERSAMLGVLYQEQRSLVVPILIVSAVIVAGLRVFGVLDPLGGWLAVAGILAALMGLFREYFRMSQLAYQRATSVLKSDIAYAGTLICGVALATLVPVAAPFAVLAMGMASMVGGSVMARDLQRHEPFNPHGEPGVLRRIAPAGMWSASGAAVHWSFSQGYSYLVAGMLDVRAVAAIAAIRMLLTPINLLSSGVSSLMLSVTSRWLKDHSVSVVFRRQLAFAGGIVGLALMYCLLIWFLRDWLCDSVLKKQFDHRDDLILLWSGIFIIMVFRDQLVSLLVARDQLRKLLGLTLASAVSSLLVSWWAMRDLGTPGALWGVLTGEGINVLGLVALSLRETRRAE